MNNHIEVNSFDTCLYLQFLGASIHAVPVRAVRLSNDDFDVYDYVEMNVNDGLEIIEMINQLPFGEPLRCHIPAFGIELLKNDEQIFLCSICWKSNNIFILNNGVRQGVKFKGTSVEAKHLLSKFKLAFNAIIDIEDA